MAYFVLALGVLMSAAGLDAIATGYPIIQVERGWTTVIAGSAVLTGGLVVIAIGLVIRTLVDIKAALQAWPISTTAEPNAVPAADKPPPAEEAMDGPSFGAGTALAAVVPATMLAEKSFEHRDEPHDARGLDVEAPAAEAAPSEPEVSAGAAPHATPAPETVETPPFDAYELQTPSTADHDLTLPANPRDPAESISEDDWLDRAFSDIDRDLAAGTSATTSHSDVAFHPDHAEPEQSQHVEPGPEPPAEAAGAHDETAVLASSDESHAAAIDPEPGSTPHDLVVIGRYEADGTSYVMYSDGSIEAQSDAGVYRFGSMAELKAFIEG